MKINTNIKIRPVILGGILFMLYFCDDVLAAFIGRVLGSELINPTYCVLFFILLTLALIINRDKEIMVVPILVYFVVFLLFLVTSLLHPEYESWFSHPVYGIAPSILFPRSGIWAFLIVWLVSKNEDDIYMFLKYTAWILMIFYTLQFVAATARGYWIVHEIDGTIRHDRYNLEFGYNLLLPVSFFGGGTFYNQKSFI